jgi:hypothetical protein
MTPGRDRDRKGSALSRADNGGYPRTRAAVKACRCADIPFAITVHDKEDR